MTSSGIRANANVVLEHANNPLHPHGGIRRPDEADAYYNNPYVRPLRAFLLASMSAIVMYCDPVQWLQCAKHPVRIQLGSMKFWKM